MCELEAYLAYGLSSNLAYGSHYFDVGSFLSSYICMPSKGTKRLGQIDLAKARVLSLLVFHY